MEQWTHGSFLRGHLPADRPDPARRPLPRTDRAAGRPPLRGGAEPLPPGGGDRVDDHLLDAEVIPGLPTLTEQEGTLLHAIPEYSGREGISEHGEIERATVHDVKAIEYYIKRRRAGTSLEELAEVVHIYCTSEDINTLSYALMVKGAIEQVWLPALRAVVEDLSGLAHETAEVPMLSRTHGQPATPTTLGKELAVFAYRLTRQVERRSEEHTSELQSRGH